MTIFLNKTIRPKSENLLPFPDALQLTLPFIYPTNVAAEVHYEVVLHP